MASVFGDKRTKYIVEYTSAAIFGRNWNFPPENICFLSILCTRNSSNSHLKYANLTFCSVCRFYFPVVFLEICSQVKVWLLLGCSQQQKNECDCISEKCKIDFWRYECMHAMFVSRLDIYDFSELFPTLARINSSICMSCATHTAAAAA